MVVCWLLVSGLFGFEKFFVSAFHSDEEEGWTGDRVSFLWNVMPRVQW